MKFEILVANSSKYLRREDRGTWFTLPLDFRIISAKLELDDKHNGYMVLDHTLPFEIHGQASIHDLNELAPLGDSPYALNDLFRDGF